jgi:ATP-dependent RNA helicase DDX24/MAK5
MRSLGRGEFANPIAFRVVFEDEIGAKKRPDGNADQELPDLPIESGFMPKLKERIRLAKAIEKAQHEVKKENHERNWLREAAEAMDVDLDPDLCVPAFPVTECLNCQN